jgi:hypothetical protein
LRATRSAPVTAGPDNIGTITIGPDIINIAVISNVTSNTVITNTAQPDSQFH